MSFLSFIPSWLWAALFAGAVATSCTQSHRVEREQTRHASTKTEFANYKTASALETLKAMNRRDERQQELHDAATQAQAQADSLRQQLDRDRASAGVASQRLRDAAATAALVADTRCASATAAAVGEAGRSAARVLADVLSMADEAAGQLAEAADRSRLAGLQCEALHDAAVNATR